MKQNKFVTSRIVNVGVVSSYYKLSMPKKAIQTHAAFHEFLISLYIAY